jgi:outer membrane protein assembly factor BamA
MSSRSAFTSIAFRCSLLILLISAGGTTRALSSDNAFKLRMLPFPEYIRFNRVEGLYLGAGARLEKMTGEHALFGVQLSGGYALSAGRERHKIVGYFAYLRSTRHIALITTAIYNDTDNIGLRRTGLGGNSASSLFFKEDYLDYYGRNGLEIELSEIYRGWTFAARGRLEEDYSLHTSTQRSLSWIDSDFRSNPPVNEGDLHSIGFTLEFDGSEIPGVYPRGHSQRIDVTRAGGGNLGGDFEYTKLDARSSWFLRGLWSQLLTIRACLGVSRDSLPAQHAFYLGGPGSLRGYPVNTLRGNHYWLVSVEHYLPYRLFSPLRFHNPFFYALRPIVFADIGSAWTASNFWSSREGENHSDLGLGIGDTDNLFRIDCAWPVGEENARSRWTIQFNYRW